MTERVEAMLKVGLLVAAGAGAIVASVALSDDAAPPADVLPALEEALSGVRPRWTAEVRIDGCLMRVEERATDECTYEGQVISSTDVIDLSSVGSAEVRSRLVNAFVLNWRVGPSGPEFLRATQTSQTCDGTILPGEPMYSYSLVTEELVSDELVEAFNDYVAFTCHATQG